MSEIDNSTENKLREQYQAETKSQKPSANLNANIRNMAQAAVERESKPIWSWPLTPVGGVAAVLFVAVLYVYQPLQTERSVSAPEFDNTVSQFKSDQRSLPKTQDISEFEAQSEVVAKAEVAEELLAVKKMSADKTIQQDEDFTKGAGKEMFADAISADYSPEGGVPERALNQIAGASSAYTNSQPVAPSLVQKPKLKAAPSPIIKDLEKRERAEITKSLPLAGAPAEMDVAAAQLREQVVVERKAAALDGDLQSVDAIKQEIKSDYGELIMGERVPNAQETPAYVRAVEVLETKNTIRIKADHANPCSLGTLVYYQLEGSTITLKITDQFDPAVMCVQMLKEFSLDVDLSFLSAGNYNLLIGDLEQSPIKINVRH